MKKASFTYKKEDGSVSERTLLNPAFLKESYNSYKDFEKQEVKYLTGIEIAKENLTEEQRAQYESAVSEYYSEIFQTLSEYIESKGLNPKNVTMKTFRKDGVQNLKLDE